MGLAVAALMAAMMAVMAAPAMAQVNRDFDRDFDNNDFRGFDFGDFDFDNENELESAPVEQEFKVVNFGDYANQCVPAVQFGNTGNFNNAPSLAQFGSGGGFVDGNDDNDRNGFFDFFDDRDNDRDNDRLFRGGDTSIDDFEPGGIDFSVSPELAVDCSNTVQQSSAASSYYWDGYWDGYWAG